MKLQAIIVDDDPMARNSLEHLCKRVENLELVETCENAPDALRTIKGKAVDLIFLDIEMPGMSGLELLEQLPYSPQIIFTTSNKEYAFEAFEYEVTDFLKKPIQQNRFLKAVEKAEHRFQQLQAVAHASAGKEIYVKASGKLIRLNYEDILYFENVGDYIKVVTNDKNHIIHGTIKGLDEKLDYPRFLKVHRSFIVNLDKIKDIEDSTIVIEKKVIPVSRAHKPILMQSLNIL